MERWIPILGLVAIMALAWLIGDRNWRVNLRVIAGGLVLQFALALFILKTPVGVAVFQAIGAVFEAILGFTDAGTEFVFGQEASHHFVAFRVLPTIIFVSSIMSVLYYLGGLQKIIAVLAWIMRRTLGTSGSETLAAAANVFLGQTEAPLMVRPYISGMTRSELMALMVGGFATIAGSVFAVYVSMGIDAGHLVSASVISAPAALLIAKLMVPETDTPATLNESGIVVERTHGNLVDAASDGALDGLRLALNVAAMLIVALALVALVDAILGLSGSWIGGWLGQSWDWSLSASFGYAFAPFAWLIGIPWSESIHAGQLLGTKMALNEFIAYATLSEWSQPGSEVVLSERTRTILTYALCGFANFGSIGIQIGGIGGIASERRLELARLALPAMLGGTFAMMMTACIAALLV